MKLTSYHREKYGNWAGLPNGRRPDPERCAESVYPAQSWVSAQCSRKCGYGPEGAFCKQHAKRFEATK